MSYQEEQFDALAEVEVLAGNVILANAELKKWTEYKDAITARLTELHALGLAPTKFSSHGYMFTLQPGRPSTAFDAAGKLQMADLRSQLVDQGHGTESIGKPFWGTREVKASAQQAAA